MHCARSVLLYAILEEEDRIECRIDKVFIGELARLRAGSWHVSMQPSVLRVSYPLYPQCVLP